MAGDSNTGGGGSVRWKVDATQVEVPDTGNSHTGTGRGPHHQHGKDYGGTATGFTVTIKLPGTTTVADFIAGITPMPGGRSVTFKLPIEDDPNQIRIKWD